MAATVQTDATIAAWSEILQALSVPAALIDAAGHIVVAGEFVSLGQGEQLVRMGNSMDTIASGLDGSSKWRIKPLRTENPIFLATAERLSPSDLILRRVFAAADDLYVVYDESGRAIDWNSAWSRSLGYSDHEMVGLKPWKLLPTGDRDMRAGVERELSRRSRSEPTWRMRAADGSYKVFQWLLLFDPSLGRTFGIGKELSYEVRPSEESHRRAYIDDLTGLASRSRTIAELDRHLGTSATPAVLFLDLDRFKVVNDSLGHAVGDQLLSALGERLSTALDSHEVMVGRLGGDEFAVVIAEGGLEAAQSAAKQAFAAVADEFIIDDRVIKVGMSIGICVADDSCDAASTMFERADMAVYRAKEEGRDRMMVYGAELQQHVDRRFELETDLRQALDRREFEPWFQPIMSTHSGRIVGVEALLRWRRASGDILAPSSFQDVVMDSGLMTAVGRQMIDQALSEFGAMSSDRYGLWLTLNVSAQELADTGFTEWFVNRVAAAGLPSSQIVIEITESVAIEEHTLANQLTVLRSLGFRIALDDFGTGHSSLAHLRTLPIDMVKIDRTFVADLVDDRTTGALTRSIVELCAALGLGVIFEGVETKAEALAVKQSGGEFAQGFLYSRPMPVAELQWRTVGAELARRLAERELADPNTVGL